MTRIASVRFALLALMVALIVPLVGCSKPQQVTSAAGVKMVTAADEIKLNSNGKSVEQQNVLDRIKADNMPGALKHLYIVSSYSGQCILYSPVKGKVTSSGKRLSPSRMASSQVNTTDFPSINLNGKEYRVDEIPADDGTFGDSIPFLYWFTPDGRYRQAYVSGGQMVIVSDEPVPFKQVQVTIESVPAK